MVHRPFLRTVIQFARRQRFQAGNDVRDQMSVASFFRVLASDLGLLTYSDFANAPMGGMVHDLEPRRSSAHHGRAT